MGAEERAKEWIEGAREQQPMRQHGIFSNPFWHCLKFRRAFAIPPGLGQGPIRAQEARRDKGIDGYGDRPGIEPEVPGKKRK